MFNCESECGIVLRSDFFLLLFVVVGFVVEDGEGPVELFGEQQADHLVGEGHFGEGDFVRCRGVGFGRETVRPAGDEHQVADSGVHFSLQERSELHGAELLAMFVEKDYAIGFFEPFPHGIEFFFVKLVAT